MSYHTPTSNQVRTLSTPQRMATLAGVSGVNATTTVKDTKNSMEPLAPQAPLINMTELQQATALQTAQRGYMSTYLTNATGAAKLANYLDTPQYSGRNFVAPGQTWTKASASSSATRRQGYLLGNSPI